MPGPDLKALLAKMTLAEKAGQLNQAANEGDASVEDLRAGKVGSIICSSSAYAGNERQDRVRAQAINKLQEIAVKESRLGIPLLIARDVIHGHRTVGPIPLGQAASWSTEDIKRGSEVASREAFADGIRWAFTPMMDVSRDPRWGRVAEGFGEDPFLAGRLAKAVIEGIQGDDLTQNLAACAKHFVGYGAAEGGRDYNTAEITPYTLRNIYLPPFKEAVAAGVRTVMSCFNEVGGVPATANRRLLTEILKDEWGFRGFVITDWDAVGELILHGVAEDRAHAAELAINAGADMDMATGALVAHLEKLVAEGRVCMETIDTAVMKVLQLKADLGLFENPYTDTALADKVQFTPEGKQTVLELAQKSLVLLKNNGVLPIKPTAKNIGLFGSLIEATDVLNGTWCLDGLAEDVITVKAGFEAAIGKDQVLFPSTLNDESLNQARYCDVAVAVVGEHPQRSGEANSVAYIDLPPGQLEWLQGLKRIGVPIVVVVLSGRPLAIQWLEDNADAILFAFHPGVMGGQAIADVLFGTVNPSGKLPITFPRVTGQIPTYYNRKLTGRPLDPYGAGVSRYVDEKDSPLYPFGFGLSYSSYDYSGLGIDRKDDGYEVVCTVANTSKVDGEEIVQLYIRDRVASLARPIRELKGFERVAIAAEGRRQVRFHLSREEFGFYGADEKWVVEEGAFDIWVGPNSIEGLHGTLELV